MRFEEITMTNASAAAAEPQRLQLLRVLGPGHVWALGVGIVLVGEYMGWNFAAVLQVTRCSLSRMAASAYPTSTFRK